MTTRITSILQAAVPIILCAAIVCIVGLYSVASYYQDQIDSSLHANAAAVLRSTAIPDFQDDRRDWYGPESDLTVLIIGDEYRILSNDDSVPVEKIAELISTIPAKPGIPSNVTIENSRYRLLYIDTEEGGILIARSTAGLATLRSRIIIGALLAAFVCTAVAGAIAYSAAARRSKLMESVADHMKRIEYRHLMKPLAELRISGDTDLERFAEGLNHALSILQQRVQQVLNYTSLTSHELRTPLAIIRNQLEDGMRASVPLKRLQEIVASAYDEIIRLNHIINDLLTLSTLQAGTLKLEKASVDLHTFFKDFYDEALILSRDKNISVVLARGPEVAIEADMLRLRQLFFNLLDNAIKYGHEKGRIFMKYAKRNGEVEIHFSDNGNGIPQHQLSRIFDPFYRGEAIQNHSQGGAGLGLSLVRWIVEAHNGRISVTSTIGEGTTFVIHLPASA